MALVSWKDSPHKARTFIFCHAKSGNCSRWTYWTWRRYSWGFLGGPFRSRSFARSPNSTGSSLGINSSTSDFILYQLWCFLYEVNCCWVRTTRWLTTKNIFWRHKQCVSHRWWGKPKLVRWPSWFSTRSDDVVFVLHRLSWWWTPLVTWIF